MSDSINNQDFERVHDYLYDPFNDVESFINIGYSGEEPEYRRVPGSSPYVLKMFGIPLQESPTTVEVWLVSGPTQLTEVSESVTPGVNEYRVNYTFGYIEFNSAQTDADIYINYKSRGSVNMRSLLDTVQDEILAMNMAFGNISSNNYDN